MADKQLNALTAASALADANLFYVEQGGNSRKATGAQIKTLVGTQLGPAWTNLTLAGSTSSVGGVNAYAASETFTGAAGKQIEIEAIVASSTAVGCGLGIGAGSTSYRISPQNDGNIVIYRYNAGDSALASSGTSTSNDYNGFWHLRLILNISAASSNFFAMEANGYRFPATNHYENTANNMVGTLTPFVQTSDITKCYARARLLG